MSEKDGFAHLYLILSDGTCKSITSGNWIVDCIDSVDEENRIIYFSGNKSHPTEKQFYKVSMDTGVIEQITSEPGTHNVTVSSNHKYFVEVFSSLSKPVIIRLRSLIDGAILHTIVDNNDFSVKNLNLTTPNLVEFKNRDNVTMYGVIYKPDSKEFGDGPYPTIVYVYGGPGVQVAQNSWSTTARLRFQYLRNKGYLVFSMDNQGSNRRGLEFEGKIKHSMGTIEVTDQVDGVNWLISKNLTNPKRVGITGWSYGGYMTLLCLLKEPEVFHVGVSGAPVTEWETYDTGYTERYMGTPLSNPDGYKTGSVLEYVHQLKGKLLLIHGLLDENVLFRHSAKLINKLNRCNKRYDTLFFPDERHMPRLHSDRVYLNARMIEYFLENL